MSSRYKFSLLTILMLVPLAASATTNYVKNGNFSDWNLPINGGWPTYGFQYECTPKNWNENYSTYKIYESNGGESAECLDGAILTQKVTLPWGDVDYAFGGELMALSAGEVITIKYWAYSSDGTALRYKSSSKTLLVANVWTTFADTIHVPAETASLKLYVTSDGSTYRADNFSLKLAPSGDTTAPNVTLNTNPEYYATYRAGEYFNLEWSVEDDNTIIQERVFYSLYMETTEHVLKTWPGESPGMYVVQMPNIDAGSVALVVEATDEAGNVGNAVCHPFNIESATAPLVTLTTQPAEGEQLPAGSRYGLRWNIDSQSIEVDSIIVQIQSGSGGWATLTPPESDAIGYLLEFSNTAFDSVQVRVSATDITGATGEAFSNTFSIIEPDAEMENEWDGLEFDTPEVEPNMDLEYAQTLESGETILGELAHEQDYDVFKLLVTPNTPGVFTVSCDPSTKIMVDFTYDGSYDYDDEVGSRFLLTPESPIVTPGFALYEYPHPSIDTTVNVSYPRYASRTLTSLRASFLYARVTLLDVDEEAPVLPYSARQYRVSYQEDGATSGDGDSYDILIWEPDPTTGSGTALAYAFGSYGFTSYITSDPAVVRDRPSSVQAVCICLGTSPNNALLSDYITDDMDLTARPLYVEGGDAFAHDRRMGLNTALTSLYSSAVDDIGLVGPAYLYDASVADEDVEGAEYPLGVYANENHRVDGFVELRSQMEPLLRLNQKIVMGTNPYFHFVGSTIEFGGIGEVDRGSYSSSVQSEVALSILTALGLSNSDGEPIASTVSLSSVGGMDLEAWPNPFNSSATVRVNLPDAQNLTLVLYDILGRRVATLHDGPSQAGLRSFDLDGGSLASGTYFLRLQTDSQGAMVRRITLVR